RRLQWLKPSTLRQGGGQTIGPKCCDPMSEMANRVVLTADLSFPVYPD
ncbi:MAG: hypothetical protein QOF66_3770, partial [Mycobacterium sp.]|nr:hypothetical protein [Mycobacterium sp.]